MSMLISIDAGHGLKTAGKRCKKSIDPLETREWILNNRIACKLEDLLKEYDCNILRVDDPTGGKDFSLFKRVKKANRENADIYISIHHNAGINGRIGGGTVVYFCSKKPERKEQAKKLYEMIIHRTRLKGNRSEKVIYKRFYVIRRTKMPAFLIENGFMDSITDTPIILTQEHANQTALGILDFLVEEFSLKKV